MTPPDPRVQFIGQVRTAVAAGRLEKLTLGKYRGPESGLQNVFIRPVELKAGPRLAFVWRYKTRDVTKNHDAQAGLELIATLLTTGFLDAHLATGTDLLRLMTDPHGRVRLQHQAIPAKSATGDAGEHDREKERLVPGRTPWLQALGVTNEQGRPREAQSDKFRQINKFAEIIAAAVAEAFPDGKGELAVVDMGAGKGYLTFALASVLGPRAKVRGIEARPELVELANQVARDHGMGGQLKFETGTIADAPLPATDILVALHACDTATDDALARGIAAGARLMLVAPCCQKELRPGITAPPVLGGALRHGIFLERHAEFATDALRAELLEWAGYRTRVFEFISTEHTAKNLMISAVKVRDRRDEGAAGRIRALAAFYGIRSQRLAALLGFDLSAA